MTTAAKLRIEEWAPGSPRCDGLAQLRAADPGRAPREGRTGPVLHLLLRQLAAHPSVRAGLVAETSPSRVGGSRRPLAEEFPFEHEVEKVRPALEGMGVDFPIALDNDFAVWRAFDNNAWPALYFIDDEGESAITISARRTTSALSGSSSSWWPRLGSTAPIGSWCRLKSLRLRLRRMGDAGIPRDLRRL